MRRLAPLLCAALIGCSVSAPVTATKPAPEPDPAVDIAALIERDGLLGLDEAERRYGIRGKQLVSATYHELDGKAPPELVIHIQQIRGPRTHQIRETLWLYDVSDVSAPRPVLAEVQRAMHTAPRVHGALTRVGYEAQGWWRAEDLDGDGRAEIVIVGHMNGVSPAPLSVWGWGRDAAGEGMIDRLWRDPEGLAVVVADVDGDGRRELVSVITAPSGYAELPRLVALKPDGQGRWREAPLDLKAGLPAMLDALSQEPPRVQYAMPAVVSLMRAHKIAPRDVRVLQSTLEARISTLPAVISLMRARKSPPPDVKVSQSALEAELSALVLDEEDASYDHYMYNSLRLYAEAMVWPGNIRAYDVLLPFLNQPLAADEVVAALLDLDAQTGQTRGREAVMAWLDAALTGVPARDAMRVVITALEALEARGIDEGLRLAAARIVDPETPLPTREALISEAAGLLYGQLDALSPMWSQGMCDPLCERLLAEIAQEVEPRLHRAARWRAALKRETLRMWLALPDQRVPAATLALASGDPGLREQVWSLLARGSSSDVRESIMVAAQDMATPMPPLDLTLTLLARATSMERYRLWQWLMTVGSPAQLLAMLERSSSGLAHADDALELPEVPCASADAGPPGCTGTRGALLDVLPELHKLVASRLSSREPDVADDALTLMASMPYEPTQRLLLDIARDLRSPLAQEAHEALLRAGHVIAQDYLFQQATSASPDQEAEDALFESMGRAMDAAVAQQLIDWLAGYPVNAEPGQSQETFEQRRDNTWQAAAAALASAAPRACAAQPALLVRVVDDATHTCEARAAAASALALCDPSWLEQLSSEARLKACGGALFIEPMEQVAARGQRAHLPALARLAEDPRARLIRELAHSAATQIKAR